MANYWEKRLNVNHFKKPLLRALIHYLEVAFFIAKMYIQWAELSYILHDDDHNTNDVHYDYVDHVHGNDNDADVHFC